jgi:hypothetical protein
MVFGFPIQQHTAPSSVGFRNQYTLWFAWWSLSPERRGEAYTEEQHNHRRQGPSVVGRKGPCSLP